MPGYDVYALSLEADRVRELASDLPRALGLLDRDIGAFVAFLKDLDD